METKKTQNTQDVTVMPEEKKPSIRERLKGKINFKKAAKYVGGAALLGGTAFVGAVLGTEYGLDHSHVHIRLTREDMQHLSGGDEIVDTAEVPAESKE